MGVIKNNHYFSSHNHGSVENGLLEDELSLQMGNFPRNHDSGGRTQPFIGDHHIFLYRDFLGVTTPLLGVYKNRVFYPANHPICS